MLRCMFIINNKALNNQSKVINRKTKKIFVGKINNKTINKKYFLIYKIIKIKLK